MQINFILPHIEALVFASDKPVSIGELIELVDNALSFMDDKATAAQVVEALEIIREKYETEAFPFGLTESGGGYQFLTKPAYFKTVALLQSDKYLKRLSTAALETLAIIAYKQPVTKGEMEHIRGVNCDYAVQKLLEKELVTITGRREGSPGQPLEYAASRHFMDYFGMNSLDELPKLNDLFPQDVTEATTVTEAHPVEEDMVGEAELHMVVNENGEVVEVMEDTVEVNDTIAGNDIDDEVIGAPEDLNGEVIEIIENPVQVNEVIEDKGVQEEDTEVPDDETGNEDENEKTAEAPGNEIGDIDEKEHTEEALNNDIGNIDENANTDKEPDDEIGNRGEKENISEAPGDETENRNENDNSGEVPGDKIENGEGEEHTEEVSNGKAGNGEGEENTEEAPDDEIGIREGEKKEEEAGDEIQNGDKKDNTDAEENPI